MIKILFVCHGNICRSPMAEFVMKDKVKKAGLSDHFVIDSAATSTEEIWNGIGNPVYGPAREELAKHGLSCKGKRAVLLKKSDYQHYDYLIGMDSWNMRNMKRLFGSDPEHKLSKLLDFTDRGGDIADPWYAGNFDRTFADIDEGCDALLAYLMERLY